MPTTTETDLLDFVLSLPSTRLSDFLDALAGLQAVEDAGWRIRERRISPERFPERNAVIRDQAEQGKTYG